MESRGWGRQGWPYLGLAAVTLLPALHKPVPTHGAAHQAVEVWLIGQAGGWELFHEGLQVGPATVAEHSGVRGAGEKGVSQGEGGQASCTSGHPPLQAPSVHLAGLGRASPDAGRHDALAGAGACRAVAALDVLIVVHAQVVAHLVGHGARHTDGVRAVVLLGNCADWCCPLSPGTLLWDWPLKQGRRPFPSMLLKT